MKHALTVVSVILLMSCESQTDDLQLFIKDVQQTTALNIEPYPEFESKPAFVYGATKLRSPFKHLKTPPATKANTVSQSNCTQPDFARTKQVLERFGIDRLSVTGVFFANGKQWALIKVASGELYKATVGDHLGLFFGKIDSIKNGVVAFTEMQPDGAGCWQKKQASLTMTVKAGDINV
ncbi:pilus assembly protein PilP [Paraglaciecola aquimarina]|uniref:Pilus assembly protein PilP n=1 Tax=Paraglaciecola aquimarina TaxID=1235557 RepID=A0ABU3SRZ4_9ALTE|nr:pilus assembly protein PilP [Paraglaciecola aquimarina]MDU0352790.1 pilus assembly protein PilP [Paraglaciecola aquimarina]